LELEPLLAALRDSRFGGARVREFRIHATEVRRLSLGVKDAHAGGPHAPLSRKHGSAARFLVVWEDGRISRGALERTQVEESAQRALEDARQAAYEDPDAARVAGPAEFPDVALHDPATAAAAGGELESLARRLDVVRKVVSAAGVRTWSASFSFAEAWERVLTSAGLDERARSTSAAWHLTLNGEAGSGFAARRLEADAEFEARLTRLEETMRQLLASAEPAPGGSCPVLLHPRVVEEYVLATLLSNLSGETVAHGEGRFRQADFGAPRPALREDLGLRLDPLQPLRSGSYRFTAEGIPAAPCTFIEAGRLVQPVLDLKYAHRLGRRPTPLPLAADCLFLEGPPSLTVPEALERATGGALVLTVLGVHTQDLASGDFSLASPQSLRIGADGFAGKLRATISGNLFDVLRGDRLELVRFEGEHTPGLLFDCRLDPS